MDKNSIGLWLAVLLVGVTCFAPAGLGWSQAEAEPSEPNNTLERYAAIPTASGAVSVSYASPRDTMRTFLAGINAIKNRGRDDLWPTVLGCLDLSALRIDPDSFVAKQRAQQLLTALDYIRWVEYDELPGAEELTEGQDTFIFFPRPFSEEDQELARRLELTNEHIALAETKPGRWQFDAKTLIGLPSLYDNALAKGSLMVTDGGEISSVVEPYLPRELVQGRWLEVKYWQWIGLMVLILLGLILDRVLRAVWRVLVVRQIGRRKGQELAESIGGTAKPIGMFATGAFWLLTLWLLALPTTVHDVLHAAAAVWTVLAGTWAAWRLIDLGTDFLGVYASRTTTKLDDILLPLIRRAVKIFVVALGIVYAANALNIPIGPMLASLGIGGLAFAFAAKDTIENFFGSVAVVLDRPFEIGDWVVIDDMEGTVEELGFRSTRIRTFYNSQITVPNATLVRASIDNYGRRKYRRWRTHLSLQYDTPPGKLIAFTEGVRELVRNHPYTRKDYYQVWCHEFSASSLDVLLYIFFEVPDWNTELRERERMFVDIVRLADRLGVSFAFPTTTVHLFQEDSPEPGVLHAPEHEPPGRTSDRRAMVRGLRAAQEVIAQQPWRDTKPGPQTYGDEGPTPLPEDEDFDPADATENTRSVEPSPEPEADGEPAQDHSVDGDDPRTTS
ncbi:MAG: mechanosensitive ion channel domain-containing protein [Planctomycetota bacterium]